MLCCAVLCWWVEVKNEGRVVPREKQCSTPGNMRSLIQIPRGMFRRGGGGGLDYRLQPLKTALQTAAYLLVDI